MKKYNKWIHNKLLGSLSLRVRFMIAPVITMCLSLVLYANSNYILQSNTQVFKKISDANLVQISDISQITIMLTDSNNDIVTLLFESGQLDEESIYVEGKKQLNILYKIEDTLTKSLSGGKVIYIDGENVFLNITSAFLAYKNQVALAIEMSSVDSKEASAELILANAKLAELTHLFLALSNYYSEELKQQSKLIEGTLYNKNYTTEISILLMLLMLWSAYYFSKITSGNLNQVYKALISLAKGDTSIKIKQYNDEYIKNIWQAVSEFKASIINNEAYQNDLLIQKFAMDQHSIIAITDIKGVITRVNEKFCQISGYSEDELIGSNHRILNSGNQPKDYWREMYLTVSQGGVWQDEILNKAKDGHLYWVETTIVPLTSVSEKSKIIGYMSIRSDITEKKQQYQKLIDANLVAESAVVAKSQFLATMSHEIRTPMNGVLGMLDLLLNNKLTPEQKTHAEVAYSSGKSLLTLIDDILDFSKIDANKLELELIHFDLLSMLEEFTECMRFQAEDKGLALVLDTTGISEPSVVGDPGRLRQILTNVVGNAIKFTTHGNIIICVTLMELDNKRREFICSVSDTGIGIPKDKISTLFNSFSQVDLSTTRKYGGSGLGLAISKRLAELMDGNISVSTEAGKGSCFTCRIPLGITDKAHLNSTIIPKKSEQFKSTLPQWPAATKVLLVEDNRINQRVAQGLLKRFGLTCEIAVNGKEALSKLGASTTSPYSVILMDCQMPKMDGYEATRNIRAHSQKNFDENIPIIAMTANAMKGDREKCLDAGMNDYLTKPIDSELLLDKLKYWICQ